MAQVEKINTKAVNDTIDRWVGLYMPELVASSKSYYRTEIALLYPVAIEVRKAALRQADHQQISPLFVTHMDDVWFDIKKLHIATYDAIVALNAVLPFS